MVKPEITKRKWLQHQLNCKFSPQIEQAEAKAEVEAIIIGLNFAVESNYLHLIIDSDTLNVINLALGKISIAKEIN